eukprot:Skav222150  [mRNA]  locus=scaffold3719:27948:29043:- [translate_table: standard]
MGHRKTFLREGQNCQHRQKPSREESSEESWNALVLLTLAPALHRQVPIGPLQDVCNAASMGQVDVHSNISQKVSGKGEHWADAIAEAQRQIVAKITPSI